MVEPVSVEAQQTVVIATGPSVEPTLAQKNTVRQMEPKISQFVAKHLQNKAFLDRFRSSRAKIVSEVTTMTPALAKKIMEDMGVRLETDEAYLLAYDIMGVTENFEAVGREKPPPVDEQKRLIQQRSDTLANYAYDPKLSEAENIAAVERVLAVLK